MPGFRPGKVPLKLIAHRYGPGARGEVINKLIPETFEEVAKQEKFLLANMPDFTEINADPGEGLAYTAAFEVYPDPQLPPLETLKIRRPVAEIAEEDVDRMIETLRGQRRTWSVADRPAAQGDRVIVDFEGTVGLKPARASTPEPAPDDWAASSETDPADEASAAPSETLEGSSLPVELGAGGMIEGFEAGLIGAKADDERVLELTYPSEYHKPELADCPVTFKVRIRSVEEADPPESDEDFARHLGFEDGDMASVRAATRQDLERNLASALRMKTHQRVVDALLENMDEMALPGQAVEREAADIAGRKRQEFRKLGIDPDGIGITPAESEPQARRQITVSLVLGKLMTLSGVTVDHDKVRERIEGVAASYQEPKRMIAWYYEDENRRAPMETTVLQEQVVAWVLEQADVTEERMSFNELLK